MNRTKYVTSPVVLGVAIAMSAAAMAQNAFAPLEQWKAAVVAGDANAIASFYSVNKPTAVYANGKKVESDADAKFWQELKPSSLALSIIRDAGRPDLRQFIFSATATLADGKTMAVTDQQTWQKQGDVWRIVSVIRTDAPALKQPSSMSRDLYPASADAHAELQEAEKRAAAEHKRVLLVFGANWCFDCHVLDLAFERPDLRAVLEPNYEVVHVDLGPDEKKNSDLVAQYQIPLNKGVPAVAVAESDGTLVVSQKDGEFENARGMTPEAMLAFLNQWKPGKHAADAQPGGGLSK
jgi:hypothetical protein